SLSIRSAPFLISFWLGRGRRWVLSISFIFFPRLKGFVSTHTPAIYARTKPCGKPIQLPPSRADFLYTQAISNTVPRSFRELYKLCCAPLSRPKNYPKTAF